MANKGDIKIISKKQGLKKALKQLAKLEKSCITIGVHRGQGRLKQTISGGGGTINMASLAKWQERTIQWIQKKTKVIDLVEPYMTKDGKESYNFVIPAGTLLKKPRRFFVDLRKVPESYMAIQEFISGKIRSLLSADSIKLSDTNAFWEQVGARILQEQKARIQNKATDPNSELTQKAKGFNHPLFDTGALLNALSFKRITGKKKSVLDNIEIDLDTQ